MEGREFRDGSEEKLGECGSDEKLLWLAFLPSSNYRTQYSIHNSQKVSLNTLSCHECMRYKKNFI